VALLGAFFCHGGTDDRRKYLLSKRLNSNIFHARKVEYHEIKNAIFVGIFHFFPTEKGQNMHFCSKRLDLMVLMTSYLATTTTDLPETLPAYILGIRKNLL